MIKLVINTPKGGVGKTTTATNLALLLARRGLRVLAVDLAGGLLMSQTLMSCSEFASGSANRILQREGERIPVSFPGATDFDYAILDTDDSFTVAEDLLLGTRPGWRVISPVNPNDRVGLDKIPREIRAVVLTTVLSPSELRMAIVVNMASGGDVAQGGERLRQALHACGIASLLASTALPHGVAGASSLILLDDIAYRTALEQFLGEFGL